MEVIKTGIEGVVVSLNRASLKMKEAISLNLFLNGSLMKR